MTATLISWILMGGIALTAAVVLSILLDRHETALREFAVMGLFFSVLIMLAYYVELNAPFLTEKIYACKFGYIGKVFICPMLMTLVIKYYGGRLPRLLQGALYIIPVLTLYFVFTCDRNTLYYANLYLTPDGVMHTVPGPCYIIYMIYNGLLSVAFLTFCLWKRRGLHGRDRTNNTILIAADLVSVLALGLYLAGFSGGYDITTIGVMLSSLLVALSILQYGLLNKEEILQNMSTALLLLDNDYRLVYANQSAQALLPMLTTQAVHSKEESVQCLCELNYATVQHDGATYQRKISEWSSRDGRHGKLLTYDDITEIRARLNRDSMTGLLNHASFYPMLDDAISEHNIHHKPLTVSIADIDHFKQVNDTYGHANGDIVLTTLASLLNKHCGKYGDVFRYGGEEFCVIFYHDMTLAEQIMQETLDEFSEMSFDFMPGHITFSFGSAEYDRIENSVSLFERADQVMYNRKRAHHEREAALQQAAENTTE